jgi:hypothetical protein
MCVLATVLVAGCSDVTCTEDINVESKGARDGAHRPGRLDRRKPWACARARMASGTLARERQRRRLSRRELGSHGWPCTGGRIRRLRDRLLDGTLGALPHARSAADTTACTRKTGRRMTRAVSLRVDELLKLRTRFASVAAVALDQLNAVCAHPVPLVRPDEADDGLEHRSTVRLREEACQCTAGRDPDVRDRRSIGVLPARLGRRQTRWLSRPIGPGPSTSRGGRW